MHTLRNVLIVISLSLLAALPLGAWGLPAFPGAEGYGSDTPGGRGGRVMAVTTLADSGPGSLREAVTAKGPRIIVFNVAGDIRLRSHLRITEPFVTIAGQTAPARGITLRDAGLYVQTHDVVIRFIRSRVGASLVEPYNTQDALQISDNDPDDDNDVCNVVIDHCSFSWSIDECVGIRVPAHDVTFSWNVVGEALRQPFTEEQIGEDRSHSMALILSGGPTRCSLHHNLLAHCNSRNPRIQGGRHAFVNNVVYDWGWLTGTFSRNPEVNFIGNTYKPGPGSKPLQAICEQPAEMGRIYVQGNRSPDRPDDSMPEWEPIVNAPAEQHRAVEPFDTAPVTISPADEACDQVLRGAGATLPERDPVDRRIVRDVRLEMGGKIDRPIEVGGYPDLTITRPFASPTPPADSDHDGTPDDWEIAQGFDPNDPADAVADATGGGYTNTERYLESLVSAHAIPRPTVRTLSIDRDNAKEFTVQWEDVELPVIQVGLDRRTFYTHAYFTDELTLAVSGQHLLSSLATLQPPRFRDHLTPREHCFAFRVNEEGPRVIRTGPKDDGPRLVLFLEAFPESAPQLDDANVIDAKRYGALGQGDNDTAKLQMALDACAKLPGGGVVFVADGQHEIDTLRVPSNVELYLARSSVLYAGKNSTSGPVILFEDVHDAALNGPGVIDGRGSEQAPARPLVQVRNATSVRIADVVLRDPAGAGIELINSDRIDIHRAKIVTAATPAGAGGVRIDGCRGVTCDRAFVGGNGDGITVVSTGRSGPSTAESITIEQTVVLADGQGVAVGPEVRAPIGHVLLRDVDVVSAGNGISVLQTAGNGGIEHVVFRDMTLRLREPAEDADVGRPFCVMNDSPGLLRDVLFDRVVTNASTPSRVKGVTPAWVEDVKFWGVRVTTQAQGSSGSQTEWPPLFDLTRARDPQFRFLYVTRIGRKLRAWSDVLATEEVENLIAPTTELFELQVVPLPAQR